MHQLFLQPRAARTGTASPAAAAGGLLVSVWLLVPDWATNMRQGHTHTHHHSLHQDKAAGWVFYPPKGKNIPVKSLEILLPFRMSRNSHAPPRMVLTRRGWWQMTWDWSMSHHGWTKQRENSPCFMGKVLEALASENPVQGWWDHVRKSVNLSSNVASSVTEGT